MTHCEKTDYCFICNRETPYVCKEVEWEGEWKGEHKKLKLLEAYCSKCGNRMIVASVEYENERRLNDEE